MKHFLFTCLLLSLAGGYAQAEEGSIVGCWRLDQSYNPLGREENRIFTVEEYTFKRDQTFDYKGFLNGVELVATGQWSKPEEEAEADGGVLTFKHNYGSNENFGGYVYKLIDGKLYIYYENLSDNFLDEVLPFTPCVGV